MKRIPKIIRQYAVIRNLAIIVLATVLLSPRSVSAQPVFFSSIDLLEGRKTVTIPFKFVNNFILLDVRIFGILPVQLIFDTGAEHIILFKRQYTDLLQVSYDRRMRIMGTDLSREVYALIARDGLVEVKGLAAQPHEMLVLEEDYFNLDEMLGTPVAGLLGGGFFKDLVIHIDYKRRKLTLIDPRAFARPERHLDLPLDVRAQKPYLVAQAGMRDGTSVEVTLLVDTGAGVPLLIHTNTHPSLHLPATCIRGRLGIGLGGYIEGFIGRMGFIDVGNIRFTEVPTSFQDLPERWVHDQRRFRHGILGNELLSRCSVYLDYANEKLYLRPYQHRQKPFRMDRSGLLLYAYGMDFRKFIVQDVIPGSPAAWADIRAGDILQRVQGRQASLESLDGISRLLQKKTGKRIRLDILRENVLLEKRFQLRDLI